MFLDFRNLKTLFVFFFYFHISVKKSVAHALIKLFELIMMFDFPMMNTSVLISRAVTLIMVNHISDLFTLLLFSQSVSQTVSQSVSQSISLSVSQSVSQSISQSVSQCISQSVRQTVSQTDSQTDRQ